MLPSDRDFAIVENHVRHHHQFVYSPDEWVNILKTCQKKKPFKVHVMTQADFLNVSKLRDMFSQKSSGGGGKFGIRNAAKLIFSAEDPSMMLASENYFGPLAKVSLQNRGRPTNFLRDFCHTLEKKYNGPRTIDESRLRDVLSCLDWIPSVYHQYYKKLQNIVRK